MRALHSEIKFLRELHTCENIITLESVYKSKGSYHLVLKYAEYGCLRDFIIDHQQVISESQVRQVMQ